MNKSYGNHLVKNIFKIILAFILLFIVGMMVGALIGGGNILTPLLPKTWVHIFQFMK
ncbi:DNA-directed RNA polymerase subunit beta [Bombilactobacillus folatiphilus]|uniref:DNA-directed RNA polymerase subunit beta n=1 Tax=Bombilactobacillus folatiphilus TaxID=2923362 RepID=A0ABY4PAL3_9LACO|nr:DNA-directed RNA polymerase subunit beta [Bombilactobacillus folatiphilus]UQS82679.1 DNA-directed RNA polymerase subunit beta [Bombilactobacillus folatiphilus]